MNRIGKFEVSNLLGDGGMGTVYLGRDPRFDRPVAIKVLHSQFARDAEVSERFRAEAIIQAKLNHPNIVTVYDFLAEGEQLAMVMELVEGETLESLLARHPDGLPEATAVAVMSQVLSAVGFAHGKGLVHRDLKPSNVMVQDLGRGELVAKVMDFGIARILGAEKMRTATSAKMGTLAYMSPEQLRSPKSVDARSDIYSLGAMLYEMLTGRVPYDADTEYELMRRAIEEEPPAPSRVVAGLGSRWDAVVARAMAKEPAWRFEDAIELRMVLTEKSVACTVVADAVKEELSASGSSKSSWGVGRQGQNPAQSLEISGGGLSRPGYRHHKVFTVLALGVALAAPLAFWGFQSGRKPTLEGIFREAEAKGAKNGKSCSSLWGSFFAGERVPVEFRLFHEGQVFDSSWYLNPGNAGGFWNAQRVVTSPDRETSYLLIDWGWEGSGTSKTDVLACRNGVVLTLCGVEPPVRRHEVRTVGCLTSVGGDLWDAVLAIGPADVDVVGWKSRKAKRR